jgi:ABC-type antimicrobial peptide transport system permease subunit
MTIQRVLFTQMPIPFSFPWTLLISVFAASIVFSVLASFSPIHTVIKERVVTIMRLVA